MSSRNVEFFCTIEEYTDLVYELISEFKLNLLLRVATSKQVADDKWDTRYFHFINPSKDLFVEKILSNYCFQEIFLSMAPISEEQLNPKSTPLGKWQWISGFPPEFRKDGFYSGDLGARSDWCIPSKEDYGDNREIFELFSKIKRKILKRITKPMWIIFSPTDTRLIRDVGYTKGAEELSKKGIVLRGLSSSYPHVLQEPISLPK